MLLDTIRQSRGRFFGLQTRNLGLINVQFRGETPNFIRVFDRNNNRNRRISKSMIQNVNLRAA